MKFEVTGSNRTTGARMSLEFEAESKAAAERKATQAGMSVHHVRDISDGRVGSLGDVPTGTSKARAGLHPLLKLVIFIFILGVIAGLLWPRISGLLHHR